MQILFLLGPVLLKLDPYRIVALWAVAAFLAACRLGWSERASRQVACFCRSLLGRALQLGDRASVIG